MSKKLKIILKYTLIFTECILSTILISLIALSFTILNKNYILNHLNKTNYYTNTYNDIRKEMNYYTAPSGFKEDILDDTFNTGDIKNDTKKLINNIFKGKKIEIDTSKFIEKLNKKIDNYIETENFKVVNYDEVHKFSTEMSKIYIDKVKLYYYPDKIVNKIYKLKKITPKLILLITILLSGLLLISKKIYKKIDLSIICFFNTFILLFINYYIKNRIDINNLFIVNDTASKVLQSITSSIFNLMIIIAILSFIFGLTNNIFKKTRLLKK